MATVYSTFQQLYFDVSILPLFIKWIVKILASHKCPFIGEQEIIGIIKANRLPYIAAIHLLKKYPEGKLS